MDGLDAGWISSFQQLEKLVGCIVHSGLHAQQIWGCHGSAQQAWGHGDEAGLRQTTPRMRKRPCSALHQAMALDRAKSALGSTVCSCPRRGGWVRLEWELSPNLQLDEVEVPPPHTAPGPALAGISAATCIQTDLDCKLPGPAELQG